MTPPEANDDRLEELRRRWEEETGSRIFLQLAEEYRHRGRHREALEVLRKGLEAHPHQVSALVALGRVQLELDDPGEAARALEKALSIDATNAMAMKLAVKAYLRQGDRDQAKQRLELYKLLNASDPDIEELEARVAGRAPARPEPAPEDAETPPPAAASDAAASGSLASEPGSDSPPAVPSPQVDAPAPPAGGATAESSETASPSAPLHAGGDIWSPTAAWPGLPRDVGPSAAGAETEAAGAEMEATSPGAEAAEPAPAPSPEPSAGPEPFGELSAAGERRRYLEGLGSEGLFPVEPEPEPGPEPQATSAPAGPPPGAPVEGEAALEPALRSDSPAGEAPQEVAAVQPPAEEPLGPSGEAVAMPAPGGIPDEGLPEGAPPPAPVAPAAAAGDRPTVTLGQLYLDQGHLEEAQRIFQAVLDREPENVQARIGLLRARASAATAKRKQQEEGAPLETRGVEVPPVPSPPEAEGGRTVEESAEPEPETGPAAPPAGAGWEQPTAAADRLQESAPPAEPATGGLAETTEAEMEAGNEMPPPLTAADLLRDADPSEPPKKVLLDAYLARLRGRSS